MCAGPKAGWITLCLFQSSCIGFFPCCRTISSDALCRIAGRSSNRWQQLLNAGDIEPHPGPPRKRPAPSQDLLQADILSPSAARYASALFEFEQFLAVCVIKSVRQLASRAALEACFTSPLAFAGNKCGRMREILQVPFTGSPHLWTFLHWNSLRVQPRGTTTGAADHESVVCAHRAPGSRLCNQTRRLVACRACSEICDT